MIDYEIRKQFHLRVISDPFVCLDDFCLFVGKSRGTVINFFSQNKGLANDNFIYKKRLYISLDKAIYFS